ncbi:hypothetical protein BRC83_09840 [Halobacteriales archaeon QS_1_68_17]|nr:MAG: hypothetical protein BRC83_09840 [Halobacteriales archaeon QS_1_68_17]
MDNRAVAPVVGKVLAVGLVVLYTGVVATAIYGGIVPEYRAESGEELGERVLSTAALRIQQAVPPNATAVDARYRVSLPATIRGHAYRLRVDGRTLVLAHRSERIAAQTRLALPPHVVRVDGTWSSGSRAVVVVKDVRGGLAVRLESGGDGG